MSNLGNAYVQIIPSAEGISGKITEAIGGEAENAGKSAGNSIVGKIKGIIVAAGIGKILKDSLMEGAKLQQSFGGLDTLYDGAQESAKRFAREAYTAGISANTYAEQAVSMGAALKASLGGDTTKAAKAANMAIMDMADNSAKMGTSIDSIQMAYQGFAKGNYTMLDNLKLGFGGTKTEMERLLQTAEKATGVKYDINNLNDVYSAIHVIQKNLRLTGVAADEAKTTFSGSFGAMKASAQNLLASLSLGEDIQPALKGLIETTNNFLFNNFIPMLANIAKQIPGLIVQGVDSLANQFPQLKPVADAIHLIQDNMNTLMPVIVAITAAVAAFKLEMAIASLIQGVVQGIKAFKAANEGATIAQALLNAVMNLNPFILITTLIAGLVAGIIYLWNTNDGFRNAVNNAWNAIKSGIGTVVNALVNFFTVSVPNALKSMLNWFVGLPGKIGGALASVISGVASFVVQMGKKGIDSAKGFIDNIVNGIIGGVASMVSAGGQLMSGLARGIGNAVGGVINKAKEVAGNIVRSVKGFFGIHSPSRVFAEIGEYLDKGLAKGIGDNTGIVSKAMDGLNQEATGTFQSDLLMNSKLGKVNMGELATSNSQESVLENVTIQINGYNKDPKELAEMIDEILSNKMRRREMAF